MEKQVIFDATTIDLFMDIERIQKEYGLKRANSIVLLKALLEEKNSMFYECLCATSVVSKNPYKQIITDCDRNLRRISKNEEEISSEEKPFEIFMSNQKGKGEIYMTDNFYRILKNTFDMAAEEQEKLEQAQAEIEQLQATSSAAEEELAAQKQAFTEEAKKELAKQDKELAKLQKQLDEAKARYDAQLQQKVDAKMKELQTQSAY